MSATATWVSAVATVALAVVAVFQDKIRRWVTRPILELSARVAPPDCHLTSWRITEIDYYPNTRRQFQRVRESPCYYFRMSIANVGDTEARDVEVFACRLRRRRADGKFEDVGRFTPMNLLWSHVRQTHLPILSPRIPKMCDLGHCFRRGSDEYSGMICRTCPMGKLSSPSTCRSSPT